MRITQKKYSLENFDNYKREKKLPFLLIFYSLFITGLLSFEDFNFVGLPCLLVLSYTFKSTAEGEYN
jgi:hypothetical protein